MTGQLGFLLLLLGVAFVLLGVLIYVLSARYVTDRAALVAEAQAAREAFTVSAGVIGEYLYSGELTPDERFVVQARGPGLAALLGAEAETQEMLDGYDDFVHPDDRAAYDQAWRFADHDLIIATRVVPLRSSPVNARPFSTGMPIVRKYSGPTR